MVKGKEDLDALTYLITDKTHISFEPYFAAERVFGERGLVMLNVMSQMCHRARDAMAMQDLMQAFHDDRPFFDELLRLFHRQMMAEVQHVIEAGVKHVFANWYYNSISGGWSPRIWQEVFAPSLRKSASAVTPSAAL